ncbi:NEDD8-activating enzyme E1 regulatory subunit [Balamuthia mandrillaris]
MEVEPKLDEKKVEKYDRQLRLWGEEGQIALEDAHICLINAGAIGTEILKNLVLPGVGNFTILDGNKVEAADLGNNFFLDFASLGQPRAVRTTELLKELNEWVNGNYVDKDAVTVIDTDIDFFKQFSLVVATELPEEPLLKLARYLYEQAIPLFVCRANGFLGYVRLAMPELSIVESKPEDPIDDLRLYEPWEELEKFSDSIDLSKLDSHLRGHVPYVILLLQELRKWKAEHDGKVPTSRDEKQAFKVQLRNLQQDDKEQNFNEAVEFAWKAFMPASTFVPYEVKEILADDKAKNLTKDSTDYWFLVAAVREFVENEGKGLLPLQGSIPDLTADTNTYMHLQDIYQAKAEADIAVVTKHLQALLSNAGRDPSSIPTSYIRKFCKNALYLRVLRFRSLDQEYNKETANKELIASSLEPDNNMIFYLLFRANDRFFAEHQRHPGQKNEQVLSDIPLLKKHVHALLTEEWGLSAEEAAQFPEEAIHGLCRFGNSQLHNIAAFLGGLVSQEIIKVLTRQWLPLNNTLIYNSMNSTTTVVEL